MSRFRDLAPRRYVKEPFQGPGPTEIYRDLAPRRYAILVNFRRMDVRRKAANMLDFTDNLPDSPDPAPDAAETLAAAQDAAAVRQAVAALPEIFREVVVFRYFEDLTVPEIAQVLDIPEGSVKSRLNRAKERIRRQLSGTIRTETAFNPNGDKP